MDTNSSSIQTLRWVTVTALLGLGLWLLNLSAFHWWAAGGPPSPEPRVHERWGNVFFCSAMGAIAIAVGTAWFLRRRKLAP